MALQFYIGGSGAGKSTKLYRDIIEQSVAEPRTRFLVIVPDQFTMETQKQLVLMHPKHGIMNIEVLSFGRLTHRIFEEIGGDNLPVLDDTGKSLILRKLAAEHEQELTVLSGRMNRMGYINEVKSAISEFMQYGIGQKELGELVDFSQSRGSLCYKLRDLKVLYESFLKAIDGRFVTTEGKLGLLAAKLDQSSLVRDSIVVFDGFTGFTPIQNRVIEKLLVMAREVRVTILMDADENIDRDDGEQKLFALSKKTIRSLTHLAEKNGVPRKPDILLSVTPVWRFSHNPGMAHLEQELFRYRKGAFRGEQDAVRVSEASTPREEVRQVCLQIRRLLQEEGYQYRDIAVVTGDMSAYADHIEDQFDIFGIRCYLDAARGIALNPFVEFIRSGLRVILEDFSYQSVFHFLRCQMAGEIDNSQADRLENYVLAHGIRGRKRYQEMFVLRGAAEQALEELEQVNGIRECLMEALEPLLDVGTQVKDYVGCLYRFIIKNNCYQKLEKMGDDFEAAGDLARAREYAQIYRLVMELFEQLFDLLSEEHMALQEFTDILDAGFGEIQVGTIPQNVDRVVVGDMERTRLKEIKALFFVGVNDGNIPKNGGNGGILSDIDREFLSQGQWEMAPTPRQQMYIQRLYLYMNMTKPEERLYVSYSRTGNDGKSLRPSYLIQVLKGLFPELTVHSDSMDQEEMVGKDQVAVWEDGFATLADQLRRYAVGELKDEERERYFFTLYDVYRGQEDYRNRLNELTEAAFYRYRHSPLAKETAKALYGAVLTGSVSRLERFASCAYSYFLQYGLELKEREEYSFEDVDMGTLFHRVLERFPALLAEQGQNWFDFTKETGERLLDQAIEEVSVQYGDSVLFSSARYQYVVSRMKRILGRTIFTLQDQLRKGSFAPEYFEVSFQSLTNLNAVNIRLTEHEKMRLMGRIDRVDLCRDEDHVYVKVIDYKSGNHSLDIAAVYYGLELQLVVYMNAAMELVARTEKGKQTVPAALLYYHVSDPMIRDESGGLSEEELREKIRQELRMTGIVNDEDAVIRMLDKTVDGKSKIIPVEYKKDGTLTARSGALDEAQIRVVSDYVNRKLGELGKDIISGVIEKKPYHYGQQTGCDYCSFKGVCGFNLRIPGYEQRDLEALSKDEALEKMRPCEGRG